MTGLRQRHPRTLVTMVASAVVPTEQLAASDGPLLEVVGRGPAGRVEHPVLGDRAVCAVQRRQTPIAAIVFTTLIAAALVLTGNLDALANTTVLLLLVVFTIVTVAVLVLRRDPVAHDHFVAPTFIPALGALVSAGMVTQHTAGIYARAGILLVVGVVLWFVNRAVGGGTGDELNVERLAE